MWSSPSTTVHSTWLAADLRGLHQPPIGSCLFVQRPNPETRRYGDLGGQLYGRPHSDLDSHRKNRYATFDFTGTGFPPLGDH